MEEENVSFIREMNTKDPLSLNTRLKKSFIIACSENKNFNTIVALYIQP